MTIYSQHICIIVGKNFIRFIEDPCQGPHLYICSNNTGVFSFIISKYAPELFPQQLLHELDVGESVLDVDRTQRSPKTAG